MARLYIRLWLLVIGAMLLLVPTNAQLDIHWIRTFADKVLYIDLSPDGNWMALGKRNTTLVYRLPDRQPVQILQGAPAVFVGSRLLAVGTEQGIELRDVPSFRVVWRMDGGRPVQASRDGKWLLTRKRSLLSEELLLWQIGPPRLRLSLPEGLWQSAALSADGRLLFVLGTNSVVEVRSTATGRILQRFTVPDEGFFPYLVASPTGDQVAVVNPSRIVVCRGDNGQILHSFPVEPAYAPTTVRFSPDGNHLAAGYGSLYENGWWRLWRLSDGAQIAGETFPQTSADEVWTLDISHDSTTLYVVFPFCIRIVDTTTGATVEDWNQSRTPRVLGFVANDAQLAISSGEGIRLYAPADGSLIQEFTLPHLPYANAISGDAHVYATYPYDNGIAVFRLNADGSVTHLVTVPLWPATDIEEPLFDGMRLSDDGSHLFIHDVAGSLHLVNVADGSVTTLAENVSGYDITPDGSLVATIEDWVNLRRVADGTIVHSFPPAQSVAFVQGGETLVVVTKVTTFGENLYYHVTRYHLQSGNLETGSVTLPRGDVYTEYSVKVSPDGKVIVFYKRGQPMRIYTWLSPFDLPQLTAIWQGDIERGGVAFSRNSQYLVVSVGGAAGIAKGFSDKQAFSSVVQIPSWIGEMPEHLRYAVRSAQTGELLHEGPVYVLEMTGYNRARVLMPLPADYQPSELLLTVQGKPFLKHTALASDGPIVLTTGDIDGDNEVTLFDFGRMVVAFGSLAGEPEYDIDADLDGDGEISLWDFGWLVNNFGAIGDE